MGYYTDFYLSAQDTNGEYVDPHKLVTHMDEIKHGFGSDFEAIDLHHLQMYAKWYDCEADMTELSTKHPDICYRLFCRGEEGDEYVQFFVNGEMEQHVRPDWDAPLTPINLNIKQVQ